MCFNFPMQKSALSSSVLSTHILCCHCFNFLSSLPFSFSLFSQMSYSSSSLSLENREKFPFFFRVIPSDRYLLVAMLTLIVKSKWSRVTVLTQDELRFRAVSAHWGAVHGRMGGCGKGYPPIEIAVRVLLEREFAL